MEQMSSILADLQIAESTVARMNLQGYDSAKVAFHYKQQQILDSYSVDSSLYNKSYEAYARYPAYMEIIYTDVLKILETKTDSVRLKDRKSRSDENPPS
jgi:predicted trehalose synthase